MDILAHDSFIALGLLKTSSISHDKIKLNLSDDFTKGSDTYPITPQQTLLLLDKYSKKPMTITQFEGLTLAQKEEKGEAKKPDDADPKNSNLIRSFTRTMSISVAVRKDIQKKHAPSK